MTFLALYGAVYVLATAFYAPTSGTRTGRFVLAHVTPLLVLSAVLASPRLHDTCWRIAGCALTLAHFHLFLGVVLALDVIFGVWPRLITTYGGF